MLQWPCSGASPKERDTAAHVSEFPGKTNWAMTSFHCVWWEESGLLREPGKLSIMEE